MYSILHFTILKQILFFTEHFKRILENSWIKYVTTNHSKEWLKFWKAKVIFILLGQITEMVFLVDSVFHPNRRCGKSCKINNQEGLKFLNMEENEINWGKIIHRIHYPSLDWGTGNVLMVYPEHYQL